MHVACGLCAACCMLQSWDEFYPERKIHAVDQTRQCCVACGRQVPGKRRAYGGHVVGMAVVRHYAYGRHVVGMAVVRHYAYGRHVVGVCGYILGIG